VALRNIAAFCNATLSAAGKKRPPDQGPVVEFFRVGDLPLGHMEMVASTKAVDQIIKIMLKYVDKKTALRMARELYNHVDGSKSVTDTFHRIATRLVEEDHHE
jgi:hypothetical protein